MKISKKSWHYRLIKSMARYVPQNLCAYVRRLMLAMFLTAFGTSLVGFIVFSAIMAPLVLFGWVEVTKQSFLHFSAVLGGAEYTVALFGGLMYLFIEWQEKVKEKRWGQPPKQPGLVRSWVAAKKSKICPLLQFEE